MRAPVLLALLALVSVASAAEIQISQPEVLSLDNATWMPGRPAIATGDGVLVAWSERLWGIYPGRVRFRTWHRDGTPRQEVPISVRGTDQPLAFWNGSEFVVVRSLPFSKFGSSVPIPAILASRVGPDGVEVDGSEVTLAVSRATAAVIGLAWDGTHALLAAGYSEGENGSWSYHLLLLDHGGRVVEDTVVPYRPAAVAATPGGGFFVLRDDQGDGVAAGGGQFAVIDQSAAGVAVSILDGEGNARDGFLLSADAVMASITWDGRAWITLYTTREGTLCEARFTHSGDVVRNCREGANAQAPAIAWDGRDAFKAWTSGGQVMTDRGVVSTSYSAVLQSDAVVDETGLLAAWRETTEEGIELRIGGIADDGTIRPEQVVHGAAMPVYPKLARSRTQTLLAWIEDGRVKAVRLDAGGVPVPPAIELRRAFGPIAVAARGDEWVVAWENHGAIEATRLTANLDATGIEDFRGEASQYAPAVAATKSGYLVAWREITSAVSRLVVEPLDEQGRRISGGIRVVDHESSVGEPAIGCGPETCLVTWGDGAGALWAMLVRHDGTRLSEDRVFATYVDGGLPLIKASEDGSFLVYRGGTITPVSAAGEPGITHVWNPGPLALGNVVTWRGRTTAVFARPERDASRLFAFEFRPKLRSVRR